MTNYTVQLNEALKGVVDSLASQQGIKPTEVIERALALYKYVYEQNLESKRALAIVDDDTGQAIQKLAL